MAHFNPASHTASGALATSGMRHNLGEILVPQVIQSGLSAKQRRLSRPNTIEEIRRKRHQRNKKEREKRKDFSRQEKNHKMAQKMEKTFVDQENKIKILAVRATKERQRALDFWRKWDKEKMLRKASNLDIHQIDRANVKDFADGDNRIGEGTFGLCMKKTYRGHVVAVKQFKGHSTAADVEKEAMRLNSFDHPGLPFVFGTHTISKPFLLVTEFYGIAGQCVTIGHALKGKLSLTVPTWARILKSCSSALAHIHSKGFIHCDIKSDNIVIKDDFGIYEPVIIDFGKMKKITEARKYKLTSKEQDKYIRYYKHVAPEIVWGRNPHSTASDIYSLGQVISLVVHYNPLPELQKIAKGCINGTPERRPVISDVIAQLNAIV